MIVIDAGAALRWFIPADLPESEIWRPATDEILIAPDLFALEVRSAALKYLRTGELSREAAADMLGILDQILPDLTSMASHMKRVWALACELDHSPYDCTYLALAETLAAPLVTADRRFIGKLRGTPYAGRVSHVAEWAR